MVRRIKFGKQSGIHTDVESIRDTLSKKYEKELLKEKESNAVVDARRRVEYMCMALENVYFDQSIDFAGLLGNPQIQSLSESIVKRKTQISFGLFTGFCVDEVLKYCDIHSRIIDRTISLSNLQAGSVGLPNQVIRNIACAEAIGSICSIVFISLFESWIREEEIFSRSSNSHNVISYSFVFNKKINECLDSMEIDDDANISVTKKLAIHDVYNTELSPSFSVFHGSNHKKYLFNPSLSLDGLDVVLSLAYLSRSLVVGHTFSCMPLSAYRNQDFWNSISSCKKSERIGDLDDDLYRLEI